MILLWVSIIQNWRDCRMNYQISGQFQIASADPWRCWMNFNNKNKPYSSWWVWLIPLHIFEDTYSLWNLCLQQTRFWPWVFKKSNRTPLLHQRLILLHYRVNRIPYHELHDDNQTIKGNKLICRHCGKIGHIIDKYYCLHGFPPGYQANKQQCSTNEPLQNGFSNVNLSVGSNKSEESGNSPQVPFTQEQCQELLMLLNSRPKDDNVRLINQASSSNSQLTTSFSDNIKSFHYTMSCQQTLHLSSTQWVLVTGASDHMASSLALFTILLLLLPQLLSYQMELLYQLHTQALLKLLILYS